MTDDDVAASEGTEAYTVGLMNARDYLTYTIAMDGAKHPSDGDDKKMAGGVASVVYNNESGKRQSQSFDCSVFTVVRL